MTKLVQSLILAAGLGALASCGGGGGGGSSSGGGGGGGITHGPTVGFVAVTIAGTTDTVCTVSTNGAADADATADTAWSTTLAMDGTHLPTYTGSGSYSATATVSATDTEGLTTTTDIHVSIGP